MRLILVPLIYFLASCQSQPEPTYSSQEIQQTQAKLKELAPTLQAMDQENLKEMKAADVENIVKNLDHFIQATCNSTKEAPDQRSINQRARELKLEFTEGMEHVPALVSVEEIEIDYFPQDLECRGQMKVRIEAFQLSRVFAIPARPTGIGRSFWMEGL